MRSIIRISLTEFRKLFFTPIGWIILTVFITQNSIFLFSQLRHLMADQSAGFPVPELTNNLFDDLLANASKSIYWYVPLITMGLLSQEKNAGTIKLLQSSPIAKAEVILGKYLSAMFFGLLMVCSILLMTFAVALIIPKLDQGWIISGILGIYLLYCAYCSIGLFMSSLTRYQVVAAVLTFAVFMGLDYVGALWQDIPLVQNVTFFMHLSGRADQFVDGLISSSDMIYFLLIIVFFLILTVWRFKAESEPRRLYINLIRYTALCAGCFLVGVLSLTPRFSFYADYTRDQHMTISKESQALLQQLHGALLMHAYTNILSNDVNWGLPESRNQFKSFFERYQRFKPDIQFDYTFYYDTADNIRDELKRPGNTLKKLAESGAKTLGLDMNQILPPEAIHSLIDLHAEKNTFVWQLQSGGRKSFLRYYADPFLVPFDQQWANSLKQLTTVAPEIIFLTGNGERSVDDLSDKGYSEVVVKPDFRYALINKGFKCASLNVDSLIYHKHITVLVIADPTTTFTPAQQSKIADYIRLGGNLLVCAEPGRADIVNPVVKPFGIKLQSQQYQQPEKNKSNDLILPQSTGYLKTIPEFVRFSLKNSSLAFPGVAQLTSTGSARVLLEFADKQNDTGKEIFRPVMVASVRNSQKIVVAGDADWLSNGELNRPGPHSADLDFAGSLFSWFANGSFPVDLSKKEEEDTRIVATPAQIQAYCWAFMIALPGALLIFGLLTLYNRNKN